MSVLDLRRDEAADRRAERVLAEDVRQRAAKRQGQDFWLGGGPEYAKYHDTKMVRGPEVFRGLIRAMRENAGDDFCLMACTGPDLCGVGLYDAARACEDSEEGRPHSFDPQGATYMQGSGNHGGNRQAVLVRTIAASA